MISCSLSFPYKSRSISNCSAIVARFGGLLLNALKHAANLCSAYERVEPMSGSVITSRGWRNCFTIGYVFCSFIMVMIGSSLSDQYA